LKEMKENARAFYDLMFNQFKPREAMEHYVGGEYIQHTPGVADEQAGPSCPRCIPGARC